MRKYLLPFIFLLNLFAITTAKAQDATTFVVGALKYTVTSENDKEVSVEAADKNALTGNVDIPALVVNDNIEYTVTAIKGSGFSQCSGLTGITLPATVVMIGDWAFDMSMSLENINVDEENNVYSSEGGVVFNKDKSEVILCPIGKTGEYSIPASVKIIGARAFVKSKFQRITLHEGITVIRVSAFTQSNIQEMRLPRDLKIINAYAFQSCRELQEIDIPASVTTIGQGAFDACEKLQSINVEEGNENYISVDGVLYNKAKSQLIQYPAGKEGSFTVPSSVTEIGAQAFSWANQLTEVWLPANLSTIGGSAFYLCTGLTKIVDLHGEPQTLKQYDFYGVPKSVVIFVPKGSSDLYKEAAVWSQFSNYSELPGEGESFVSGDFNYTILSDTGYDVSVEAADKNALTGNVDIPASVVNDNIEYTVTAIEASGFSQCSGLTGITLPPTVVKIGNSAFDLSMSLENIKVDKENDVFSSEDGIVFNKDKSELILCPIGKTGEYIIPASVKTIGGKAFFRSKLQHITLQQGITEIGWTAFCASNVQQMRFPNDLKTIGLYAFQNCNELQEIYIPASVTDIGYGAFDGCKKLQSINVKEGNENYISEDGVLYNKAKSELIQYPAGKPGSFTVPSSVTEIGGQAFNLANQLTEIWLPTNLSTIGRFAFYQCTGLTKIVDLRGEPQALTQNDFSNVPESVEIFVPKGSSELYKQAPVWSQFSNYSELPGEGESFVSGDFKYTILSDTGYDVRVEAADKNALTGNVAIPASVVNDNIEYTVTAIKASGFSQCSALTGITLPPTVVKIGNSAFDLSMSLENIEVDKENNVYSSYDGVLFDKDKKSLLCYPQGKTGEEFTVPAETEIINSEAFRDSKLRKVNLGENLTTIDNYAFIYSAIEEVVFPPTLTTIGYGAFLGSQLVEVNLPEALSDMNPIAFNECEKLQNINVAEGNEQYSSIDGVMFNKDQTLLIQYPGGREGEYTIPSSVTVIGQDAFSHSTGLTSVTIPASVETIEDYAFYCCTGLERINDLSLTPQQVDYSTFTEASENVVVRIFKGSKENYETADGWKNFQNYEELPGAGYSFIAGEFKYTLTSDYSFEVSVEAADKETLEGDLTIPAITTYDGLNYTVVAVQNEGFYGCKGVVSYSLPSTIASIGVRAFNGKSVEAIEVSENNQSFSSKDGALFDKNQTILIYYPSAKEGQYEIPSTTKTINENAFENSLLTDIYIPEKINVISPSLFISADRLQAISVAEENAVLSGFGGVLFNKEKTELLKYPNGKDGEYLIPEGVEEIGENAFNGSRGLTELLIPSSVETIGVNAFGNCSVLSKLTSMSLLPPAAIEASFANIPATTILYVPVKSMEAYSGAEGWSLFTDVRGIYGIGDTVIRDGILFTVISDSEVSVEVADEELSEENLIIPANVRMGENDYSVTVVKEGGFRNLQGITGINIPSTIRLIGAGAFAGCSNVETIDVDDENEFYSSVEGILYNKDNSELIQAPGMLKEIEIAENVKDLGEFAFAGCKDLTKIVCLNSEPLVATQVTFQGVPADAVIYVPAGSGDAYRQAEGWKLFADIREIGDLKIELNATTLVMSVNSTSQLTAEVTNETLYAVISEKWESSDPNIAEVSESGEVTAIADGKAVISYTVTLSNGEKVTVSCNVTVDNLSDVKGIFGEIDYTAPYMIFDLKGVFVGDSTDNLPSGIYIIRQGKIVKKVRL